MKCAIYTNAVVWVSGNEEIPAPNPQMLRAYHFVRKKILDTRNAEDFNKAYPLLFRFSRVWPDEIDAHMRLVREIDGHVIHCLIPIAELERKNKQK